MAKPKVIAVDFDGTLVVHEFPYIGREVPGGVTLLKELQGIGYKIILHTVRSGVHLEEAVQWFASRDIDLWGVNKNPTQAQWSQSPKTYAELYIDDAAVGCPLIYEEGIRPYVDFKAIRTLLIKNHKIDIDPA